MQHEASQALCQTNKPLDPEVMAVSDLLWASK